MSRSKREIVRTDIDGSLSNLSRVISLIQAKDRAIERGDKDGADAINHELRGLSGKLEEAATEEKGRLYTFAEEKDFEIFFNELHRAGISFGLPAYSTRQIEVSPEDSLAADKIYEKWGAE